MGQYSNLSSSPSLSVCLSHTTRCTQLVFAGGLLVPLRPFYDSKTAHCWLTVSHVGISIYHFITPTHFHSSTWQLPLIFSLFIQLRPEITLFTQLAIPAFRGQYATQHMDCPVGWDIRMHQLHTCIGVRPSPQASVLDRTLNNLMVRFQ